MLLPRYVFYNDYIEMYDYLTSQPHADIVVKKGEQLWEPGIAIQYNFYIKSGLAQTYILHENGQRKIMSYHGSGTIFPGCQKESFKIESATVTVAITDMEVMRFRTSDFYEMVLSERKLSALYIEWISKYINLHGYELAHQRMNDSFTKLCNLLYLLSCSSPKSETIAVSQEEIAEIIGNSRVKVAQNIARLRQEGIICTHRNCIGIIDKKKLTDYCSDESHY